jgi:hypothetical protein
VLECHGSSNDDDVDVSSHDSKDSNKLKCKGNNTGDKVELKVGTEDNQRIVAVQPAEKGKGSTFALVYVQTRGKDTI